MSIDFDKLIKTKSTGPARSGKRLNILFGTTEVVPYAKTGGLGDVSASLPKALAARGHHVYVVTPLYKHIDPDQKRFSRRLTELEVPLKAKSQKKVKTVVWETRLSAGVTLMLLDYPEYFDRDGLYGYAGGAYDDNAARFSFFSRALVELAVQFSIPVDVIHCNDWHTSLAPIYFKQYYQKEMPQIATVLTIHNMAFQGEFAEGDFDATGLSKGTYLSAAQLKAGRNINFMKGGIVNADKITTVSPTYAEEIRTKEGGHGLDTVLKKRKKDLSGILNGADYSIWSPGNDQYIPVRYDKETLNGKRRNKAALQHMFELPVRPTLPLIGFVGRLTDQKGVHLMVPAVRKLLKGLEDERAGFQCVFLGEGDAKHERALQKLAKEFPERVAVHVGYSEDMAHKLIAASDILAVPSEFEPCGLTQIYAMRYGTIPVVHQTGGLADTVRDVDSNPETGTGFVFEKYTKSELWKALDTAATRYRSHRKWRPLMMRAMNQDFSWAQSAQQYESTYYDAIGA